jgi:hypothetical protein
LKRGTIAHPKTLDLSTSLNLPLYAAVGILESLWHFCQQYARRGDIGRHSDSAISRAIGWDGEPSKLIAALIECRWIDICECHRLKIHDWPEHVDQSVERSAVIVSDGFLECYEASETVVFSSRKQSNTKQNKRPKPYPRPKPEPKPEPLTSSQNDHDPTPFDAALYTACFNAVFGRRVGCTPKIESAFQARLSEGYSADKLVALPLLVEALGAEINVDATVRGRLNVGWLLRSGDGSYAGKDGVRRPTKAWVEDALQSADKAVLLPRLCEIADRFGLGPTLEGLGVRRLQDAA